MCHNPSLYPKQAGPMPTCNLYKMQKTFASTIANADRVPATGPLCNDIFMYYSALHQSAMVSMEGYNPNES